MSKRASDQIADGLNEALAAARGEGEAPTLHLPAKVDVKAIRRRTGLTQKDFATTFGFGFDQLKQWEQGRSRPVQPLRAYLLLIDSQPLQMVQALRAIDRQDHANAGKEAAC